MGHICGRRQIHSGFLWGNLKERDHLEDLGADWRIILKLNSSRMRRTGPIWHRIGTHVGLL
jgi:hypothetical protein